MLCPEPLEIRPIELPATAYYPGEAVVQQETLAEAAARVTQSQAALSTARETLTALERRRSEVVASAGEAAPTEEMVAIEGEVAEASLAVREAERAVLAAQAELSACVARMAADNARVAQDPASSHADQLAAAAGNSEALAQCASAEYQVAQAERQLAATRRAVTTEDTKSEQAVATAEAKLAETQKRLEAARAAASQPASVHTPLDTVYPATSSGRRAALAHWIASDDNPLTPRVAVNHIWLRHFGTPLVDSVFDFGLHGSVPTHPELLDWLAREFVAGGWSQKKLHRLIVLSSVYRLDSSSDAACVAVDSDNRTLWRMPTRRAEAEVVRDSLLHVAGMLDLTRGGPDLDYQLGQTSRRRSLYFRHANEKQMTFLQLFDAPSVTECYQRVQSIVPQQGLALTNSPLALAQSRRLARLLDERYEVTEVFIGAAFETVLGRLPTEAELAMCEEFLASQAQLLADVERLEAFDTGGECEVAPAEDPGLRARESLVHVLLSHHDFVTIR